MSIIELMRRLLTEISGCFRVNASVTILERTELSVFVGDQVYPFLCDDEDFANLDVLFSFIRKRIEVES